MTTECEYKQISKGLAFQDTLWGKWYCVTYVTCIAGGNLQFPRYMSPDGWQTTSYYFESKRDAQLAFGQHGWKTLPVSDQEIRDRQFMNRSMREMFDEPAMFDGDY